jgi:hypothetical protein
MPIDGTFDPKFARLLETRGELRDSINASIIKRGLSADRFRIPPGDFTAGDAVPFREYSGKINDLILPGVVPTFPPGAANYGTGTIAHIDTTSRAFVTAIRGTGTGTVVPKGTGSIPIISGVTEFPITVCVPADSKMMAFPSGQQITLGTGHIIYAGTNRVNYATNCTIPIYLIVFNPVDDNNPRLYKYLALKCDNTVATTAYFQLVDIETLNPAVIPANVYDVYIWSNIVYWAYRTSSSMENMNEFYPNLTRFNQDTLGITITDSSYGNAPFQCTNNSGSYNTSTKAFVLSREETLFYDASQAYTVSANFPYEDASVAPWTHVMTRGHILKRPY